MSLVGVCGDGATTTAVMLAATWPGAPAAVVELDARGGSLAAWFDLTPEPSLSDAVTSLGADPWSWVRTGAHGTSVLTAPVRSGEAARAVADAHVTLLPRLAARDDLVAIADLGRDPISVGSAADLFDAVVVVHRQRPVGQQAEAVRVRRFASSVARVADRGSCPVVVVVGRSPYRPSSIVRYVTDVVDGVGLGAVLADDPLAASVVCGHLGVSVRRFARLPLVRDARRLAIELAELEGAHGSAPTGGADRTVSCAEEVLLP